MVTYYRITQAGMRFAKHALGREARRRYENAICGLADSDKIRQRRKEHDAWLKSQIRALDGEVLVRITNSTTSLIPALLADSRA